PSSAISPLKAATTRPVPMTVYARPSFMPGSLELPDPGGGARGWRSGSRRDGGGGAAGSGAGAGGGLNLPPDLLVRLQPVLEQRPGRARGDRDPFRHRAPDRDPCLCPGGEGLLVVP